MTDSLRTRIAAVQREHRLVTRMIGRKAEKSCLCGWRSPEWDCTFTDHPEHVADAVIRELEDGYILVPKSYTIVKAVTGRMDCNPHPDAPHGFDRNASHDEGRNVCDCERWSPPDEDDPYEAIADAERQQWADDEGIPR